MVRIVKKTIKKARPGKKDVDGDMCSTHNKKRKAEYLIDDGAGGMCCAPGDECKPSKEAGAEKVCKWCEQGECWSHGQIEKPERKERKGKKGDVDGDVCSVHGKSRKAEYLIDDGEGGMCCAPGDECKSKESGTARKPERKRRGKADDAACKWCEQGECWSHGQIEKPESKRHSGKKDVDGDVCSTHGKKRKAEYLIDDGEGGMCCSPGDECKEAEGGRTRKPTGQQRKGSRGNGKGKGKGGKSGGGMWVYVNM